MIRPGPVHALIALVAGVAATGVAGCGKTCERT